ncbi:hypothetical protein [Siminovitchia fordii]|uniref:Uncharacterized protein n=1 Tax=Siminovitchia fordii TaxID=254759 RepID=A0ABQ4KAX4_9BACI|nr:hypothetical protein [Siminovitchia fordii]GIN22883.1 hypothetical protein J1TS3_40170 [Siminovitchia fordii]
MIEEFVQAKYLGCKEGLFIKPLDGCGINLPDLKDGDEYIFTATTEAIKDKFGDLTLS